MKSLRDEIPLRGEKRTDLISSEAVRRRFHPNEVRISSCEARFHFRYTPPARFERETVEIITDLWYNEVKEGGELYMNFSHCDKDEKYLSLHDCIAEQAYFENGKLGFEFNDGFWISPDHPESNLSNLVRTDFSKVEYTLEDGADYDVTVYVFKKNLFKKTIRVEWTIQELINNINNGKCKLEFLYQYVDYNSRIVECELKLNKKPYRQECIMKISAPETRYYWNNLRKECPW